MVSKDPQFGSLEPVLVGNSIVTFENGRSSIYVINAGDNYVSVARNKKVGTLTDSSNFEIGGTLPDVEEALQEAKLHECEVRGMEIMIRMNLRFYPRFRKWI